MAKPKCRAPGKTAYPTKTAAALHAVANGAHGNQIYPLPVQTVAHHQPSPQQTERSQAVKTHMTEPQLQSSILDLCRHHRLLAFHIRDSRRNIGVGFPDLVICGVGGVIFRELKNATLQPTPEQMTWLGTLDEGGADAALWRPQQWEDGTVRDVLARLAKPRSDALNTGGAP